MMPLSQPNTISLKSDPEIEFRIRCAIFALRLRHCNFSVPSSLHFISILSCSKQVAE